MSLITVLLSPSLTTSTEIVEALESYSAHLEPSFVQIKLPPTGPNAVVSPTFDLSPSYIASLDKEFARVYDEYTRRIGLVQVTSEEIIKLWAELGTPQAQTDTAIVQNWRDSPEQLGLHQEDLARLKSKKDTLIKEKQNRERRLKDLRTNIEALWDKLGIEQSERKQFLTGNRGCGLRAINEFESELARLNELKRQNLHLFVEDARYKLQELWDSLYFAEEEMLEFTPAFSDVYSDALLSAHEAEIERLEALREQRAPTLTMVDRHRSLVKERDDLQASSQDASRLMARGNKGERRDPGKLLREEKMRKRIAKELPKVEADLKKVLEDWEDEYGRPFLVHGQRYLDELYAAESKTKDRPARSKTPAPANPPPAKSATKSSTVRASTMRGAPPSVSRSKTPVGNTSMNSSMIGRNPFSSSVSAHANAGSQAQKSPSRIPARLPLKPATYGGGNSPTRESRPRPHEETTIRKMAPPRAPPPKMKDLFVPPPTPAYERSALEDPRSASIVRSIAPEDPYSESHYHHDHSRMYQHSFSSSVIQSGHPGLHHAPPPSRPESRVMSNGSSATTSTTNGTMVSGSENWETYDSASDIEPEADATEQYYAKVRAARQNQLESMGMQGYGGPPGSRMIKRATPEAFRPTGGIGKKPRMVGGERVEYEYDDGHSVALVRANGSGSHADWEDD